MKYSRIRKSGSKAAAFVYAGYKWFEDNTDDVERWSSKAEEHARGKRYERFVVQSANASRAAARWVRQNGRKGSPTRARKALEE